MLPPYRVLPSLIGAAITVTGAVAMVPFSIWVFLTVCHKLGLKPEDWA